MKVRDHIYHLEMMLQELEKAEPKGGDTRLYLSADREEKEILLSLIRRELGFFGVMIQPAA